MSTLASKPVADAVDVKCTDDELIATLATGPGVGRRNDRSERDEDRASARGDRQGHPGRQSHHEPGVWRIDDRRVGDHGHALPQRQTRLRLAAKLSTTCRAADGKGL